MILKFILYCCLLYFGSGQELNSVQLQGLAHDAPNCLTGSMTDVQSWVDQDGMLISANKGGNAIDLSDLQNPIPILEQHMTLFRGPSNNNSVEYLSMARCQLTRVPPVFTIEDTRGRPLYKTVRFMTLFGNHFQDTSVPGEHYEYGMNATSAIVIDTGISLSTKLDQTTWAIGFQKITFKNLRELDLRSCHIQVLNSNVFSGMPRLQALYLSENNIIQVETNAFNGLTRLIHLDLSRNFYYNQVTGYQMMSWGSVDIFTSLENLVSLDFSHTKLSSANVLRGLGRKFQRLSLCHTGISRLRNGFFENTTLKLLDVSGNNGILSAENALRGLENSLEVLYADSIGLQVIDMLYKFEKLEVLKVSNNEITGISPRLAESWLNVQILDFDSNRIGSWFNSIFSLVPNLRLLSLRSNNINMISEEMIHDIEKIYYIGLSGNFYFCNCHSREFYDVAFWNEAKRSDYNRTLETFGGYSDCSHLAGNFHLGFLHFNQLVQNRKVVGSNCTLELCQRDNADREVNGNFLLFDYNEDEYTCFVLDEGVNVHFSELKSCGNKQRDSIEDRINGSNAKVIALMVIPIVLIPLAALGYFFRRSFKYFIITMRNSALLSLINKSDHKDDGTIFNYDVFVSYCNEDRPWVLDNLLPHVENDCNVSVCLHERDFQVGLSILENIVSCMDRSRFIMLIISQRFLLSQWCQFEMHLAQHRLLETRREDLILILLEDIPRRLRPNTLHYLMLTKTYIIWPKDQSEQMVFWRRVKKTLVTQKAKQTDNVSLA